MAFEMSDHEIQADEMADYIEWRKGYAIEDGQIEDVTPGDGEEDAGHQDGLLAMEEDRRYDQTDEEQEWLEAQMLEYLDQEPEPQDPSDEELEEMNRIWQDALKDM